MAKVRREGTVYYDKERKSYRAAFFTPEGKRMIKRFADEQAAKNWLVEQQNSINKGLFVEPDDITLGQWLIDWLQIFMKGNVRQRTFERYVSLVKHTNSLSKHQLQKIQPLAIQNLYRELESNISSNTIHKVHKILVTSFKKAFEIGILNKNIMTTVAAPKFQTKEIEIFTQDDIKKVLSSLKEDRYYKKYYPFVLTAIATGVRLGELLGLRLCDVDLKAKEITIAQNLQAASTGIIFEKPKTKAGLRRISIPDEVVTVLTPLKTNPKVVQIDDIKNEDKDTLIFRTEKNTPIIPQNFNRAWRKILEHADVDYKNFHVLRHTHATQLLAAGIPIVEVSRRLGHSKTSHTLDLYGQAIPNYDKGIGDKISDIFQLQA